jgi:hypothetical protein
MKLLKMSGLALALMMSLSAFAKDSDKEVTIKGVAQCAKCSLKKADKCANVIVTKDDGKETIYYIADDADSKKALPHKDVCQTTKEVEAKGTVKEKDGKKVLTLASIKDKK